MQTEHILVAAARLRDFLFLHGQFDGPDLVTQAAGLLEAQLLCRRTHPLPQQADHLTLPPGKKSDHPFHQFPILGGADGSMAGGAALADLVKQAGAAAAAAERQRVVTQGENAVDLLQGLAHRPGRGIGSEIQGAVAAHPAGDL